MLVSSVFPDRETASKIHQKRIRQPKDIQRHVKISKSAEDMNTNLSSLRRSSPKSRALIASETDQIPNIETDISSPIIHGTIRIPIAMLPFPMAGVSGSSCFRKQYMKCRLRINGRTTLAIVLSMRP